MTFLQWVFGIVGVMIVWRIFPFFHGRLRYAISDPVSRFIARAIVSLAFGFVLGVGVYSAIFPSDENLGKAGQQIEGTD